MPWVCMRKARRRGVGVLLGWDLGIVSDRMIGEGIEDLLFEAETFSGIIPTVYVLAVKPSE